MRTRPIIVILSLFLLTAVALLPARAQSGYSVVLLVIDDFTSDDIVADDYADAAAEDNCAVNLEGQGFYIRGVSAEPVEAAHGNLVYSQLEDLLAESPADGAITLVAVDIHGLTTDAVAELVTETVADNPADFYVLNMSFAVIPCDYVEAFAEYGTQLASARGAKNLNRYRGLFQRAVVFYDDTVFPAMSQRAQDTQDFDPLQEAIIALGDNVVAIASAGNFGMDFPFWPGAWGQVVSVSASNGMGFYAESMWDHRNDTPLLAAETDQPGVPLRVSNYGEVMMPGEYAASMGDVSGTSFAAPRLSMAVALYLSQAGESYCRNGDGFFGMITGEWDNLRLDLAAATCPDISPYLP